MPSSRSDHLRQAWQSGKYSNRKKTLRWDRWTFTMDKWLRRNAGRMNVFELGEAFEKEFYISRTRRAMETRLLKLGLSPLINELTANQVANFLGIDDSTAIAWIKAGLIPGVQMKPGMPHSIWRVKPADLERFIETRPEAYYRQAKPKGRWRWLAELTYRRDPLYTLEEVALMLGTRPHTLREHIKLGLLPATARVAQDGRIIKWFVKRSQLEHFLKSSLQAPDNTIPFSTPATDEFAATSAAAG